MDPGSGEMMKACLAQQVYAVGICKNLMHKKVVMDNLTSWVKGAGLVNVLTGAPEKPADLVGYEQKVKLMAKPAPAPAPAEKAPAPPPLPTPAPLPQKPPTPPPGKRHLFAFGSSAI